MGTVEISQEEYKTLIECQVRINMLVAYVTNESDNYINSKEVGRIIGTAYPVHEEKND